MTKFTRVSFQLFTTSTLLILSTVVCRAESFNTDSPAFHFQLTGNTTNPHCVATQLQPPPVGDALQAQDATGEGLQVIHALTAAHCFRNFVKSIHIGCRDSSVREAQITSFSGHPTHDAVFMELLVEDSCLGKDVSFRHQALGEQHQNQQLDIPAVVRPTGQVVDVATRISEHTRIATILSVDQETLRLDDQLACLKAGDSGYPLLLDGQLVAMLISGLDGCPTEQIAIRIDRIASWISTQWTL